jgi:hypothetical protein
MELLKIGKTLSSSLVLMGMAVMVSPLPLLAADPLDVALPSNATITLKGEKKLMENILSFGRHLF